jgi:hypothetical protein
LLVQSRTADDCRGNLGFIRFDDPDPIFRKILAPDLEGTSVNNRLNQRGIEKAESFR